MREFFKDMKMKKLFSAIALSLAVIATSAAADPKMPGTETGYSTVELLQQGANAEIEWISVEEIAKSLEGKPPMAVGFDIDDTVLFSSPGFYRGQQVFSPGGYSYLKKQAFWDKMNCGWDNFSMPKETAGKLVAMHQKRGDDIFFITGRTGSECETTTEYLKNVFGIENMNKVIFAGSSKKVYLKTAHIKDNNIKMYYGDSDGDIISARQGGAEGFRIMRSAASGYKPTPKNGVYGEKVVRDSQF